MTKTTKGDFDFFKSECNRWIKAWNLDGWGVEFCHYERLNGDYANINLDVEARKATISFSAEINASYTREQMAETAKHEIIHLFLGRFSEYARKRHASATALYEAEEELVQKLLRLL